MDSNKDDFYTKLMGEFEDVNQQQAKYYRTHQNDSAVMRSSLADFMKRKLVGEKLSDS